MIAWAFKSFLRKVLWLFAAGGLTVACADAVGPHAVVPADLHSRAENGETIRVIVELEASGEEIHAVQERILQAISGTSYRLTRRYQAVPFIALEVSAEALRRLAQSPGVRRIQEDRMVHPQEKMP